MKISGLTSSGNSKIGTVHISESLRKLPVSRYSLFVSCQPGPHATAAMEHYQTTIVYNAEFQREGGRNEAKPRWQKPLTTMAKNLVDKADRPNEVELLIRSFGRGIEP